MIAWHILDGTKPAEENCIIMRRQPIHSQIEYMTDCITHASTEVAHQVYTDGVLLLPAII